MRRYLVAYMVFITVVWWITNVVWPGFLVGFAFFLLYAIPHHISFKRHTALPFVASYDDSGSSIQLDIVHEGGRLERQYLSFSEVISLTLHRGYPYKYSGWSLFPWQDMWYIDIEVGNRNISISSLAIHGEISLDKYPSVSHGYSYLPAP